MIRKLLLFALMVSFTASSNSRVINLPNNIINGKNVLQQSMMDEKGVEYRVRSAFDLEGQTILLPEGSYLSFTASGSLNNGTIVGQNSFIKASKSNCIFNRIIIQGTWSVPNIFSEWFDFSDNSTQNMVNFKNLVGLTDGIHHSTILIAAGSYPIRLDKGNETCMSLKSNTKILLNGTLKLEPNDLPSYRIIYINKLNDVTICGKGLIIGDVEKHFGDMGQWGMGIWIKDSRNVVLKDVTICNCWGDCIYIGQSNYSRDCFSENILIKNVTCSASRRQGLSIISGKNIRIVNSRFCNIGTIKFTRPGHGIDIEPNIRGGAVTENIVIKRCIFDGNKKSDFSTYNLDSTALIVVKNCVFPKKVTFSHNSYNITMKNCDIFKLNCHSDTVNNIVIKNSKIQNVLSGKIPTGVYLKNCATAGH